MSENIDNIVYTRNVIEFVTVANEYCAFVENADTFEKVDFISRSQKILSLVYLKASLLPEVETLLDENLEKYVAEHDWAHIQEQVRGGLGTHDLFVDINDSVDSLVDEFVNVCLSEIFADIYQDLKDFLTAYRIGHEDIMNDALWECKQNFEHYWGVRLLAVIRALHVILYSEEELDEDM